MIYYLSDNFYQYCIHIHGINDFNIDKKAVESFNNLRQLHCHIFSFDSLPPKDDDSYDKQMLFCYVDNENKLDELLPLIPFKYTILAGPSSISYFNLCPDICHYYNVPYIIDKKDNLIFREAYEKDFDSVYSILKNDCTHNIFNNNIQKAYDKYLNMISQFKLLNCGIYCIFDNDTLAGFICINYRININAYEASYYIDKKYRKKSFAKTYLKKAIQYFYNTHSKNEILYCRINPLNQASIKTALACGFKEGKRSLKENIIYYFY